MTAPRPGDRVRVVIEGEFLRDCQLPGFFIRGKEGYSTFVPDEAAVEVLPPPEPTWWPPKPGDHLMVGRTEYAITSASYGSKVIYPHCGDRVEGARGTLEGFTAWLAEWAVELGKNWQRVHLLVRDGKPVGGE